MSARLVVAVHKLGVSHPSINLEAAGFTDDGEPIIRKRTVTVRAGEFVELPDDSELGELFRMGAVRDPTDAEIALRERQG